MGQGLSKKSHFTLLKAGEQVQRGATCSEDLDKALALIEEAILMQPTYYLSYMQKGKLLIRMGRHEEALSALDLALEFTEGSEGNNYAVHLYKSEALEGLDEFEEAAMERAKVPTEVRHEQAETLARRARSLKQSGASAVDLRYKPPPPPTPTAATARTDQEDSEGDMDDLEGKYTPQQQRLYDAEGNSMSSNTEYSQAGGSAASAPLPLEEKVEEEKVRKGDIVDEKDLERFQEFKDQWIDGHKRQRNVQDFLHGRRGWYVQSTESKRQATRRGDRRSQLDSYDTTTTRSGSYNAVGKVPL